MQLVAREIDGQTLTRLRRLNSVQVNQMSDIFLVIFFVSIPIGLKKPIYGGFAGMLIGLTFCFFRIEFYNHQWIFIPVASYVVGLILPFLILF